MRGTKDCTELGAEHRLFSKGKRQAAFAHSEGQVVFCTIETRDLVPAEIHSTNNDWTRIKHFSYCRIDRKLHVQGRRLLHIQKEKLGPEQAYAIHLILQDKVRLIRSADIRI